MLLWYKQRKRALCHERCPEKHSENEPSEGPLPWGCRAHLWVHSAPEERLAMLTGLKLLKAGQLLLLSINWIQLLHQQITTACQDSHIWERTVQMHIFRNRWNNDNVHPRRVRKCSCDNTFKFLKIHLVCKCLWLHLLLCTAEFYKEVLSWPLYLYRSHMWLTSRHSRPLPWPPLPHRSQWRSWQHSGSAFWLLVSHQFKARVKT